MPAICVTPPADEPISIDEARLHIKEIVPGDLIDAQIMRAVKAGRRLCENDTRRALMPQTWKVTMDHFPHPSLNSIAWYGPPWGGSGPWSGLPWEGPGPLSTARSDCHTGYELWLPYPPLISVDSIAYVDENGAAQTMALPDAIQIDDVSIPARLAPAYGTTWPTTRRQQNAVSVTFTCGYADAAHVPETAKSWILLQLGALYQMREAELIAYRETPIVPKFVDRLLDDLRVRVY